MKCDTEGLQSLRNPYLSDMPDTQIEDSESPIEQATQPHPSAAGKSSKAQYKRRRTEPTRPDVARRRNEHCQGSIQSTADGCKAFWERRGMSQPSVSHSMPMGGITEEARRWVSKRCKG